MATLLYGCSVLWCGPGTNDLIGARSFGLFALLGVAHCLSQWRYGRFSGLLWGASLTFLIGVSQSRLALGIAIAMFPMSQIPTRRMSRLFKMIGVSCADAVTQGDHKGYVARTQPNTNLQGRMYAKFTLSKKCMLTIP